MALALMWFRRDLRLADNEAFTAAAEDGSEVVCAFVAPSATHSSHAPGLASRAWLVRSLASLDADLRSRGSALVTRIGPVAEQVVRLAEECRAVRVHCQRDWTPNGRAEEDEVRSALGQRGVELRVSEGQLLVTPDTLGGEAGYRVFTPFHRAWRRSWEACPPLPSPEAMRSPALPPSSAGLPSPQPGGPDVGRWWEPGEAHAHGQLAAFVRDSLAVYEQTRDLPAVHGTSELSPRLAWGELSPRQVAWAVTTAGEGAEPFLRQLGWREFAYHVLHHQPRLIDAPLRPEFEAFPWVDDEPGVAAWKHGKTGYPLVDAGMRQLAATGWMHNRVRLLCASFLAKDLLVPWQAGEAHFRERLVDYDPAANAFNWQWVAGSGADAAPYFRIFSPVRQGERFDRQGGYVRRWVPELAAIPDRWIHRPWEAPPEVLGQAGVVLGEDYPERILDHAEARHRALAAFEAVKQARRHARD